MTEDKAVEKGIENQFNIFLLEYLKNVKKKLPTSIRAQQMKTGGFSSELVIEFETKFLKEPFLKALKITAKAKEGELRYGEHLVIKPLQDKIEQLQNKNKEFLNKLKTTIEAEYLDNCCPYKSKGKGSMCYICITLMMIEQKLKNK